MKIENNEVIDPTYSGNVARFINHSCDPNCETRKWTILNEVCVGIFAVKDMAENEELTFDYQFDFFKTPFTRCYCGTANCKGYLGVANKDECESSDSDDDMDSEDSNPSSGSSDESSSNMESEGEVSENEQVRLHRER